MRASRSKSAICKQLVGREQCHGPRRVRVRQADSRIDQDPPPGAARNGRVIIYGRRRPDIGMGG
jgi:hypothetical protein